MLLILSLTERCINIFSALSTNFTEDFSCFFFLQFFSIRAGALSRAILQCRSLLDEILDGDMRGVWLLTQLVAIKICSFYMQIDQTF